MDQPQPGAREHEADLLASLAWRVAELEREVAGLKRAGMPGQPAAAAVSAPPEGPVPALPVPPTEDAGAGERTGSSKPLPPPLERLPVDAGGQPRPAPAAVSPPRPPRSLEDRLGGQVFNRVGIVALLIAASWGLKLAFENQLIGPIGRIVIGLLAGAGLVLWSERFRRKGYPAFSYSLKAVGTGVLYLTLWAAFQIYDQLPASVALTLMIAVTAWNAFMSWSQDSELLAAYALVGAFATPLLLSSGGNHEIFLFTYIGTIDLATLLLVRLKPWPRLLLSALTGTIGFYFGWYLHFYNLLFSSASTTPPFAVTTAFVVGFGAIFALGSVRGFLRWTEQPAGSPLEVPARRPLGRSPAILSVLVPFLNAAFVALALSLLVSQQFQTNLLPWLMAALALVYLLQMRVQRTVTSAALHLALAVIFLTVAIPLKASGHSLTIAWFAEGIALLWASTRIGAEPHPPGMEPRLTPARILRFLCFAGYLLGLLSLGYNFFVDPADWRTHFLADLLSALFAAAAFAAGAWLSMRPPAAAGEPGYSAQRAVVALFGLLAVALVLSTREFASRYGLAERPFLNLGFLSALIALGLLAAAAALMLRLPREAADRKTFRLLAAITSVVFNLLALLSVETEINALWQRSEANLQRSLAVSGFLMLYGALLLTIGFLRRSAFTRWQALVLILFTVLKVFLYDMSSLSQGYRVVSFLGLGVLLMTVSFAYQKDWLGLKSTAAEPPPSVPGEPVQESRP